MSFRLKTILGVAIIALVMLLLVWSALGFLSRASTEQLAQRIHATTELTRVMATDAIRSADLARLQELVAELVGLPSVTYVDIRDRHGVLASTLDALPAQQLPQPDRELGDVTDGQFDAVVEIVEAGQPLGTVRLGFALDATEALLDDARQRLLTLAVVTLLLVGLFSFALGHHLTGRLRRLAQGAEAVTRGDLAHRVSLDGHDEVAKTAQAFDRMLQHLDSSHRGSLAGHHDTELALAQARESERYLESILAAAVDGIVVIDERGRIERVNKAVENLLGYPAAELVGHNVSRLMPEPHRSAHDGYLATYLRTGEPRIIGTGRRVEARHRDGTLIPVDLSVSEIQSGDRRNFVGLLRDLRLQHHLEQQAERQRTISSAIAEASLDGLITIDAQGTVVEFNPAAETIFGYPRADAIGQPLAELVIPEEMRAMHHAGMRRYLETGEGPLIGQRAEVEALRANGERFPVELALVANEVGDQTLFTAFMRDISERKATDTALRDALQAAEEASKAKSRFLAHMSHELRSPLNAVLGALELLQTVPPGTRQQNLLQVASSSGQSLLSLINDVLDFSRVEAGHLKLEPEPTDLAAVIRRVLEGLSPRAAEKDVRLLSVIDPALPDTLLLDPARLRQVLQNLCDNAVKFTDAGAVTVAVTRQGPEEASASESGSEFEIVVQDSGIGIPPGRLEHVFEEFEQVDDSASTRYSGSGLGLTISRQIVQAMGGRIGVTSTPGRGSRFVVGLPLVCPAPHDAPHGAPPPRPAYRHAVHAVSPNLPFLEALRGPVLELGASYTAHRDLASLARITPELGDRDAVLLDRHALPGSDDHGSPLTDLACRKLLLRDPMLEDGPRPDWLGADDGVLFMPLQFTDLAAWLASGRLPERDIPGAGDPTGGQRLAGHVLVVDDIAANRLVARNMLEDAGLVVDDAQDGHAAIARAAATRYDAILMDVRMPGMNGVEATRSLREAEGPNRTTPIIAVTANADEGDLATYLDVGMNACVTKPFTRDELLGEIQRWIDASADRPATQTEGSRMTDHTLPPLLDQASLDNLARDTSAEAVPGMLTMFVTEVERRNAALGRAVAEDRLTEVGDEAHALKGLAGTFGALRLQGLALALERAAREGRAAEVPALHDALAQGLSDTLAAYRAHLASAP